MNETPAGASRGRHAKPPSQLSVRWNRMLAAASGRRRLVAAGAGGASLAVVASLAAAALTGGGSATAPRAAAAAHTARSAPSSAGATLAAAGDPDELSDALPYLRSKDPGGGIVKHVTDVRRSGTFVRVYTDLGEDDENSKPAISLCEWTVGYLKDGGEDEPRVFVHGKSSDNGSVVLANKQSDSDDCKVPDTP
ncbi:hypothetical protein [Actinomadura verrucosospora]|uniref:Uncharacterized protein n=1 Tax=Actinomadura verrucosospora TaxID=46165 RepID=A0A7D3ZKR5_ACTVE|nr:hypothetical protein [Actinomadura verrucosospora]QKG20822.1 hypothetical protein ACTIVE_2460 [Actinomadura verrucosospora]